MYLIDSIVLTKRALLRLLWLRRNQVPWDRHFASLHHGMTITNYEIHFGKVVQIHVWPPIHYKNIRQFAWLQRAQPVVHIQNLRVGFGGRHEHFRNTPARGHKILQFTDIRAWQISVPMEYQIRANPTFDPR